LNYLHWWIMFLQILIQSNKQLHIYSRAMHHVVRGDKLHSWQTNLKSFDHDVLVYYSIWKGKSKILDQEKYYHRLLWHGLSGARSLSKLENRHCRWNNKHFNHLRSQLPVLSKYLRSQPLRRVFLTKLAMGEARGYTLVGLLV